MKLIKYQQAVYLFIFVLICKLYIYIYILNFTLLGGGDADYYHLYAIGEIDFATNIWPTILYYLNKFNFYNRDIIKYFLFFISSLVIPIFIMIILKKKEHIVEKNVFWSFALIISLYPSLFFFTIDIYRDISMICLFLINIFILAIYTNNSGFKAFFMSILFIALSIHLFFWRPYLGFSLLTAFFLYKLLYFEIFGKISSIICMYILILSLLYSFDFLEPLLTYRGEKGFQVGNLSFSIGLMNKNIFEFLYLFIYNVLIQLFGLYIININTLFLFFTESLPFIFGFFYIYKNSEFLSQFEKIILLFCIVYATIWIIGNDNLGTAIRLRMYNYIGMFIVVVSLYIKKSYLIRKI